MSETKFISEYPAWGKTPHLGKLFMTITEKIDGTNALVSVREVALPDPPDPETDQFGLAKPGERLVVIEGRVFGVRAGSRTRWISPESDNFGFCAWVHEHAQELVQLGVGKHYGEWWGAGIGRRYGLVGNDKRFSLFNTFRPAESLPACVSQVPILYKGAVSMEEIQHWMKMLEVGGSVAAPGFMQPEGLVVWLKGERYKYVLDAKGTPKTREEKPLELAFSRNPDPREFVP